MGLKAGDLKQRITLRAHVREQDPMTGAVEQRWVDKHVGLAACFKPLSSREFIAAAQVQSRLKGKFILRYREGIDSSMRLVFRGTEYQITGVMPDGDTGLEYLVLYAED